MSQESEKNYNSKIRILVIKHELDDNFEVLYGIFDYNCDSLEFKQIYGIENISQNFEEFVFAADGSKIIDKLNLLRFDIQAKAHTFKKQIDQDDFEIHTKVDWVKQGFISCLSVGEELELDFGMDDL